MILSTLIIPLVDAKGHSRDTLSAFLSRRYSLLKCRVFVFANSQHNTFVLQTTHTSIAINLFVSSQVISIRINKIYKNSFRCRTACRSHHKRPPSVHDDMLLCQQLMSPSKMCDSLLLTVIKSLWVLQSLRAVRFSFWPSL